MVDATQPHDLDLLRNGLVAARAAGGFPIVFGGEVRARILTLNEFLGTITDALHGLQIRVGRGLGGKVLEHGRPAGVEDYKTARNITHEYDEQASLERIDGLVAVPVVVNAVTRAIIYGGTRERVAIGARKCADLVDVARQMGRDIEIRDHLRSISDDRVPRLDRTFTGMQLEELRAIHSDLRDLATEVNDRHLRCDLLSMAARIARLRADEQTGSTQVTELSKRELDVLMRVARGGTNADIAEALLLSTETVKSYLASAMRKMSAHTRHAAVVKARRAGLIP